MDEHRTGINNLPHATSVARKTSSDPTLVTYPVQPATTCVGGGMRLSHSPQCELEEASPFSWEGAVLSQFLTTQ